MSQPSSSVPEHRRPDLGFRGVAAVLTPAENPTVEPELSVLVPPDINLLASRMHSPQPTMQDRLVVYETQLERWLAPFGATPLDAIVFACTGSSYLVPPEHRHALTVERSFGPVPVIGAANAVEQALRSIDAHRIVLVSPYPAILTSPATAYWTRRGFETVSVVETPEASGVGHPIYNRTAANLLAALRQAVRSAGSADAIVAMGTGAPSLPGIAVASLETDIPIISSNLTTAWLLANSVNEASAHQPISDWLAPDAPWRERLWSRFPILRDRLAVA